MKASTMIVAAIAILFVLYFVAQGGAPPRTAGQRVSVAGTPDKVLGGSIGGR